MQSTPVNDLTWGGRKAGKKYNTVRKKDPRPSFFCERKTQRFLVQTWQRQKRSFIYSALCVYCFRHKSVPHRDVFSDTADFLFIHFCSENITSAFIFLEVSLSPFLFYFLSSTSGSLRPQARVVGAHPRYNKVIWGGTAPGVVGLAQLAPMARLQWSLWLQLFRSQKEREQEEKSSFRGLERNSFD